VHLNVAEFAPQSRQNSAQFLHEGLTEDFDHGTATVRNERGPDDKEKEIFTLPLFDTDL
jgi:hypothetical protein